MPALHLDMSLTCITAVQSEPTGHLQAVCPAYSPRSQGATFECLWPDEPHLLELAKALGIKLRICDVARTNFTETYLCAETPHSGFNVDLLYYGDQYELLYARQY